MRALRFYTIRRFRYPKNEQKRGLSIIPQLYWRPSAKPSPNQHFLMVWTLSKRCFQEGPYQFSSGISTFSVPTRRCKKSHFLLGLGNLLAPLGGRFKKKWSKKYLFGARANHKKSIGSHLVFHGTLQKAIKALKSDRYPIWPINEPSRDPKSTPKWPLEGP